MNKYLGLVFGSSAVILAISAMLNNYTPSKTTAVAAPIRTVATPTPVLPTVGTTSQAGGWAMTLDSVDTFPRLFDQNAQGVFVVFRITAHNVQREVSALHTWDFQVTDTAGTRFSPTELTPFSSGQIQPGLSKQVLVVFDLNPKLSGYVLYAAKIPFRFSLP